MLGERVGSYVITELLAQGGMGAVYLAEHELLHRPAAIKMLLPSLSADPDVVARFFDEARAATAVADPGIVQIFDFGYHHDGRAYLVMERLEGDTLDVRLEGAGFLPPPRALRIARQLATSLEAAHAHGVIHRDLKLENVLLVHDPVVPGGERAKILDFGIAKLQPRRGQDAPRSHTRAGAIMGTPLYMSPEQCRDSHDLDGRSDIYALGCLLFCMVTGRAPFDHPSAAELIAAHLREPPPAPSQVNPGLDPAWRAVLDAIVLRCLEKDPADRFQRMSELADAIGLVLDEPIGAAAVPPRAPTPSPRRPTPLRPTTLSAALGETLLPGQMASPPRRLRWAIASLVIAVGLASAGWVLLAPAQPVMQEAARETPPAPPEPVPMPVVVAEPVIVAEPEPEPEPEPELEPEPPPVIVPQKRESHDRTAQAAEERPDDVDRGD